MPAFFVHGVPDSHRMWVPLLDALGRDGAMAPDLPGFAGAAVPEGFDATKEAYADWLAAEVAAVGEPVDLVGHDWGAMLCLRVASTRPELIRTLVVGSGPVDEAYIWHDAAQLWQTPQVGEQVMAGLTPDALASALSGGGVPPELAAAEAALVDDTTKASILSLYRSAVDVGNEWGPALDGFDRPALVLWGADDPYCGVDIGQRIAARMGARFLSFPSTGHWWPVQRADDAASAIRELWERA